MAMEKINLIYISPEAKQMPLQESLLKKQRMKTVSNIIELVIIMIIRPKVIGQKEIVKNYLMFILIERLIKGIHIILLTGIVIGIIIKQTFYILLMAKKEHHLMT